MSIVYFSDEITVRGCTSTENQISNMQANQTYFEEKRDLITCDTDYCNILTLFEEDEAISDHLKSSLNRVKLLSNAQRGVAHIDRSNKTSKAKKAVSKCITCNSESDKDCVSNLREEMVKLCAIPTDIGCYHKINGELSLTDSMHHILPLFIISYSYNILLIKILLIVRFTSSTRLFFRFI